MEKINKHLRKLVFDCLDSIEDLEYWSGQKIFETIKEKLTENALPSLKKKVEEILEALIKRKWLVKISLIQDEDTVIYGYKCKFDKSTRKVFKMMKRNTELSDKLWDLYPNEWILYRSNRERELIEVIAHDKDSDVIDKIAEQTEPREGEFISETFGYPKERR